MFIVSDNIEAYAFEHSSPESGLLRELAEETRARMPLPQMLTGRIEGRFLRLLIQLSGARTILELGTYTGYSALSMAEALPPGGSVTTCEIDADSIAFARRYFSRSEHGHKIKLIEGPALQTVKQLKCTYDFAFIDADKINYPSYIDAVIPLINKGGLIVLDNALWSGSVLAPSDDEARAIAKTNSMIRHDDRVENVLLTVRDGMHLMRRI